MKSTGIVRKVDELGRVVLPVEVRKKFDIYEKDPLEFFVEEDQIILRKMQISCALCGNQDKEILKPYKEKYFCICCLKELKMLLEL